MRSRLIGKGLTINRAVKFVEWDLIFNNSKTKGFVFSTVGLGAIIGI